MVDLVSSEPPLLQLSIPRSVVSTRRRLKTTMQAKSSKKKKTTRKKRTRSKKVDHERSSSARGPIAHLPKPLGQHRSNDYRLTDMARPRPRRSCRVREFNSRLARETYMARAGHTMNTRDKELDENLGSPQQSNPAQPAQPMNPSQPSQSIHRSNLRIWRTIKGMLPIFDK